MPRPKEFDPEVVLERAIELFRERGYEASSTTSIVEAVGIARGSLYQSFGTKPELFDRALRAYALRSFGSMIDQLDASDNPIETIRGIFRAIARAHVNGNRHGCLMVNTTVELAIHDGDTAVLLREQWKALENSFAQALSRAQAAGAIADKSPRALARFLIVVMRGMGVGTRLGVSATEARDVLTTALGVLE